MSVRELELLLLDVDADKADAREFLPEDRQDGADSAAHLEQACPRLELSAVADQPVAPVLGLLDEPMLLACSVAVNVLGYASRLGSVLSAAARVARSVDAIARRPRRLVESCRGEPATGGHGHLPVHGRRRFDAAAAGARGT